MKLAKIRHRVVATILDNLIILGCVGVLLLPTLVEFVYALVSDATISLVMIFSLVRSGILYNLFILFYYMVIPIFIKGQTVGKWFLKIKVISDDDKDVDYKILFFREALCRILVRTLSMGMSSVVSFIIMTIRDDKKSLADVFAKTKVIDIKEGLYANSTQQSQ